MAKFKIEHFKNETATLRDLDTDECMHSSVGAWAEAQALYIEQSQLKKRFTSPASGIREGAYPCVLYDVGLGIGANAIAALQTLKELPPLPHQRRLHLISFEKYPEGMAYALDHQNEFPYLKEFEKLIRHLLFHHEVSHRFENGVELEWQLKVGDFRDFLPQLPSPELIYFDLYSPKKCPELWGVETFQALYQKTLHRREQGHSTFFITYSASTAIRAALLLSGFFVGYGVATSDKKDTTVASTVRQDLSAPLSSEWLEKWKRSGKPYPHGLEVVDRSALLEQLSKLLEKK